MPYILGSEKGTENPVYLSTDTRLQNTVVYGAAGSGKSRSLMLSMAMEQFEDAQSGATFICSRGNTSWLLDRLAHKHNRDVVFLHPEADRGTSDYLETEYHTGAEMQKNLIDYADAIETKKVVIVDFDLSRHRKKGRHALIKLMYHLQRSIVESSGDSQHFVYIDDAEFLLPYIQDLLCYGKDSAVGTTLLLSSYTLLESRSRAMAHYLNSYTATTITMNRLTFEDFQYFNRRFYGNLESTPFRRRSRDEIVVETIRDERVDVISVKVKYLTKRLLAELEDEANMEQVKRSERKRPRRRGVFHAVEQTTNDVETGFDAPLRTDKVFLDEDEFFANL